MRSLQYFCNKFTLRGKKRFWKLEKCRQRSYFAI
jgi:hypothetical protein